ncbi:SANT/Myb_domain [Hexamita inflata]|uniref:SANT/Myb domain n=1 Tax=Hexamita inflata TaxID=28002 RepID=A0AA86TPB8_9EUKA|nr:SANT/Myb domain [Hexamita inflata]
MQREYKQWSEAEISQIISICRSYKERVLNWNKISSAMGGRSPQQCKSFYNNKIKPIEKRMYQLSSDSVSLAAIALKNLLCVKSYDKFDHIKQIYCDHIQIDVLLNVQMVMMDNKQFNYNMDLIKTVAQVLHQYLQHKDNLARQIEETNMAIFESMVISKEQYQHLSKLMNSISCETLYQKLLQLLKQKYL